MAGKVEFFNPTDPFGLEDWEVQKGPNPSLEKQRASALDRNGDEFAHVQFGAKMSGTCEYVAKKFTGTLAVPPAGLIKDGWHVDSATVSYTLNGYPTLSISCHKHVDGTADANCREYAPTFSVPARAIGAPTTLPDASGSGSVFGLSTSAKIGVRSMTLSWTCNHVDEDANDGGHFASDNYDGSETLSVDFTGNADPSTDWTLDDDWTDDTVAHGGGNTEASTTSLSASHHIAHTSDTGTSEATA